jgi:hypothetical protein
MLKPPLLAVAVKVGIARSVATPPVTAIDDWPPARVELKVMRPSASAPTTTLPLRAVALTAVCSAATSEVESG